MTQSIQNSQLSRYDFQVISDWIAPESRVVDLGCGNGELLKHLQSSKNVHGYGVELSADKIAESISNGINVIQFNLDQGLGHFDSNSFDTVVLSLTLQAMKNPRKLLEEMMRVAKQGIVTFPNFAHWQNRFQIAIGGRMPVSKALPYTWYNTPNIHLCTLKDFHALCDELGFEIDASLAVRRDGRQTFGLKVNPNLFGEIAICRFKKRD